MSPHRYGCWHELIVDGCAPVGTNTLTLKAHLFIDFSINVITGSLFGGFESREYLCESNLLLRNNTAHRHTRASLLCDILISFCACPNAQVWRTVAAAAAETTTGFARLAKGKLNFPLVQHDKSHTHHTRANSISVPHEHGQDESIHSISSSLLVAICVTVGRFRACCMLQFGEHDLLTEAAHA